MVDRNRPRLNITLDSQIKKEVKRVAGELNLSVSRLLEYIIEDFLADYPPADKQKLVEEIESAGRNEKLKEKQIENILREFDS